MSSAMHAMISERMKKYHAAKIEAWGVSDPRALGYSDESSQLARFKVIAELYGGQGSVLDLGCGTGQLMDYLRRRYGGIDYVGIDQQPEFIQCARYMYCNEPLCEFLTGDFSECFLPPRDVVVASGALSYRSDDSDYYLMCINRFFSVANHSLILNMLDSSRMFSGEVIVGHSLAAMMAHCRTLTPHVSLVSDYLPFDFTLKLEKACQ